MTKDLTTSDVSRQNILNNGYALEKIELNLALGGTHWHDERVFTKAQVANILQIDERTIDRYIETNKDEITQNGYTILKGQNLKEFKGYLDDIHVADISRAPSLGVFSFRAVLNIAMLVLVLGAYFLELNGYDYCVRKFIQEMENIVVWLAEGKINDELLLDIIISIINEDEFNESIKLKIIENVGL